MLVLAAVWWAWGTYAWLTSTLDIDEGGVRLAMLAATALMLGVALAVPGAFGADAVLFGVAYMLVRVMHLLLSVVVGRNEPDRLGVMMRFAPSALAGATLIVAAGFLDGDWRLAVDRRARIDYVGPGRARHGRGLALAPEHFAERHGLVILIALGESIVASASAPASSSTRELISPRCSASCSCPRCGGSTSTSPRSSPGGGSPRLAASTRRARPRRLHAICTCRWSQASSSSPSGCKTTLRHVDSALDLVPAAALCGGTALYLLAHVGFLYRSTTASSDAAHQGAIVLLVLIPVATVIPSLAALAVVSGICALVVAYEAIARREFRVQLRHPDGA